MATELVVPALGESVSEGEVLTWRRADGDVVAEDEIVVELETDKTTVELPAPAAGVLRIVKNKGDVVAVGELLARIEAGGDAAASKPKAATAKAAAATAPVAAPAPAAAAPKPAQAAPAAQPAAPAQPASPAPAPAGAPRLGPAARRAAEEAGIDPASLKGTGPGGRATKSDVAAAAEAKRQAPAPAAPPRPAPTTAPARPAATGDAAAAGEHREKMTRLRRTIADRLVQAQHTAAILTTFNEIDMSAAMELRARHKERFEKTWGVSLGFMSLFARACVLALRDVPLVNARIEGEEIVMPHYVNLGIAASTDRGLVVPVVRGADRMGLADLEREIGRLAGMAREGSLAIDDLAGGTFTISNGGVFGSLLSTPILNPPQSGILGMHKIEKRAVVVNDQIVVRPMMYVALSYDHRLIDGRDAVTFLVRVKERVEDPARMLLEV